MAKLVLLRGLPCSGKTTYAAQLVMKGYKRVNHEDLRIMVDNGFYSKQNEKYIIDVAQTMVALALQCNLDVVYDNYNLNSYIIKWARAICRDTRADLEIVNVDTPIDVCIQRDLARDKGRVGRDVIIKMKDKYFKNDMFPIEEV